MVQKSLGNDVVTMQLVQLSLVEMGHSANLSDKSHKKVSIKIRKTSILCDVWIVLLLKGM